MRFRDPFDKPEPRRDDHDRERPSWRELDARRNRSRHVQQDKPERPKSRMEQRGESLAKQALNELFSVRKTKEQEAAWKKVCAVHGNTFSKRSKAYVDKFGMPRQWDDLLRLLDHDDTKFVATVLDRMLELAPHESASRKDLLTAKLRILSMTCEDQGLLRKMETSLQSLGSSD